MSKTFVDMEADQERFKHALYSHCKLVLIEGEAGTGKSTLVQRFKSITEEERIPAKLINFRDTSYSPLDILYSMADLIGKDSCNNLQIAIADFAQSNNIVVKDNRVMFGSKLTIQVASELNQKEQNNRNAWYRQITKAFFDDLANSPIKCAVLFLDTYEQCDETVSLWVGTHLLPLLGEQEKLRTVIAGQKVVKLDIEWDDLYIKVSLAGLELSYWFKYIELRQIQNINPDWLIALYKVFDGKPAAMITALEKLQQEPLPPVGTDEEKYWDLLRVYLQQVDDVEQNFIKSLAVFHWFDERVAEYIWEKLGQGQAFLDAWSWITNLPFAAATSRGISFHELYRNALLFHLWHVKKEVYLDVSEYAAKYFDSEDSSQRIEQVYHLLISDPPKGRALYQDMIIEFQDSGMFSIWHTLNQYGLEHIRSQRLDPQSTALIWEASGQYFSIHGRNQDAIEQLKIAQDLYEKIGDKKGIIRVLYSNAAYQSLIGRAEESKADLEKAYDLASEIDNDLYAGHIMYRIAELTNFGGNPQKAYGEYKRSLEWFEKLGDFAMQARNLMFMAETSNVVGLEKKLLYQKAIPLFEQGWHKYHQMRPGDPIFSPTTFIGGFSSKTKVKLFGLFNIAIDEGDCLQSIGDLEDVKNQKPYYEKALTSYTRALPLAQQMKDLRWSARANLRMGDINVILGKLDKARQCYQHALGQANRVFHKLYVGWAYVGMGNIARISNEKEEARKYYLQAQELYLEVGAHSNIGWQIKPNLELLDTE